MSDTTQVWSEDSDYEDSPGRSNSSSSNSEEDGNTLLECDLANSGDEDEDCVTPLETSDGAYVMVGHFLSRFDARVFIDESSLNVYRPGPTSTSVNIKRHQYICVSHEGCAHTMRVSDNLLGVFTIEATGRHSDAETGNKRVEIHRSTRKEVLDMLAMWDPKRVYNELWILYGNDLIKQHILPSPQVLKSSKQSMQRITSASNLRRFADVIVWALSRLRTTRDGFFGVMGAYDPVTDAATFAQQSHIYQNELIVLRTFCAQGGDLSLGLVLASRKLFRNTLFAVVGQQETGVIGMADGTYKLHKGGWTLIDFGTTVIRRKDNQFVHSFVPWAYRFVRSESTEAYNCLFSTVKNLTVGFFGVELVLRFASHDHSHSIRNAFETQ